VTFAPFLVALAGALMPPATAAPAGADDRFALPAQTIAGAAKPVPLGELVDLTLSPLAEKPKFFLSSAAEWKVFDISRGADGAYAHTERRVRTYADPDGQRGVFFGTGVEPKRLLVVCSVTYLYAVMDDKKPDQVAAVASRTALLHAELVVGTPDPTPPPVPPGPKPDPTPTPTPTPPPGPTPPPDPNPDDLKKSKLFAVIVEETGDAASTRGAFLASPVVNKALKAGGHVVRVVDKDVVGVDGKPPADVAKYMALAAGKPYPSLYLVDEAGKTRFSGPMPNVDAAKAFVALLAKYEGSK
jgi:hypothetical protein